MKEFCIPKQLMPSFYMLTKNRPQMIAFNVTKEKGNDEKINAQMKIGNKVVSCTVVNFSDVGLEGV